MRSTRTPLLVLGAILLGLAAAACVPPNLPYEATRPSPSSSHPPAAVVYLKATSFTPPEVHIRAGETVEWVWLGHSPHNVTFRTFHSPTQVSGTWSHRFTFAGTYYYRSTINYRMEGRVVVS